MKDALDDDGGSKQIVLNRKKKELGISLNQIETEEDFF